MTRYMLVTADDYGIGPETSRGILDLAAAGAVTSTVLLVNSPFAVAAVERWKKHPARPELGWHPCLTLDRPVLPADRVLTLVDDRGHFLPLGRFLRRLLLGRAADAQIEAELRAQYRLFLDLVGRPPANVNAHHHAHVFGPVRRALARVLAGQPRPHVRRVAEPWRTLAAVPGARAKRLLLSAAGRLAAGPPGNDALIGITNPPFVHDPAFFLRWLRQTPGRFVELTCHPGHLDDTLDGRDGTLADGQLHRRAAEYDRLRDPAFLPAVREAGFTLVTAAEMAARRAEEGFDRQRAA